MIKGFNEKIFGGTFIPCVPEYRIFKTPTDTFGVCITEKNFDAEYYILVKAQEFFGKMKEEYTKKDLQNIFYTGFIDEDGIIGIINTSKYMNSYLVEKEEFYKTFDYNPEFIKFMDILNIGV